MGLSRLDNFLKNTRGEILYVDPSNADSTDSIENRGNSLTRPFKTIQRALIEAARFSYQRGLDNDRFGKTTIMLYPGDHYIDNRPGWIPSNPDGGTFYTRSGQIETDFRQFDLRTNFDINSESNVLYKFNSVYGGVIIPRGTSLVGLDLRKTKIRPRYVPDPVNDNIERSAIFRVTGICYFWQFSILDADPNRSVFKDYTSNVYVPNFSHHKLTAFEYADGLNNVNINDNFLTYSANKTDLDLYYEKVGIAYGPSSGREIPPLSSGSTELDIQPKIDEFRIVGSTGGEVGITSIKAGNGVVSSNVITVTLEPNNLGLDVDTPIRIEGIAAPGYDGQYVVSEVVSSTEIKYQVSEPPVSPLVSTIGASLNISVDTVTSASPYIFNISLRSVYGMCGLHADGSKVSGFKSMVVAQFTGIGLQKDPNAFVKYDGSSGIYRDVSFSGNQNINTDSLARFKPEYENYHIKCSNDSFIQVVSVFAIGYASHFIAESGGDLSITNSNSNFGAKSLCAYGFRSESYPRDDVGYITHIIPPKELDLTETTLEFSSIDVEKTVGIASTTRLYLYDEKNQSVPPDNVLDGYRIGAKVNERLNVFLSQSGITTQYSARVIMSGTQNTGNEITSEKSYRVSSSGGANFISGNTINLTSNHLLSNGETVRVISSNGYLPDGINPNQVYYAITTGLSPNQLRLAQTLNDALNGNEVTINNKGGFLTVVSRVSDKNSGDVGHPIQYDSSQGQWYINVGSAATDNSIYSTLVGVGTLGFGLATPRTFITRRSDTRPSNDSIYKVRYVIPKDSSVTARPPSDGFIIQESGSTVGITDAEVAYKFNPSTVSLSNSTEIRNNRFIANASWNGTTAEIVTELPHDLNVGCEVKISNVTSTNNTVGAANSGYNGTFTVAGISSSKHFSYLLTDNPGTFTNSTSVRTTSLPNFQRKKYNNTYLIYRTQEIKKYINGEQDGVYHLTVLNSSNSPNVEPFTNFRFLQPVTNLYPQINRDNPASDPKSTNCFALPDPIGQVVVNDPQNSITKETIEKLSFDSNVGFGITNFISNATGTAHTISSRIDHGLNRATALSIVSGGAGYGSGIGTEYFYNARLVGQTGTGENATVRIKVESGVITNVKIMDGGSAFGVGNTLSVVGVATTTGYSSGLVNVTSIYNNVGDIISVSGISSLGYENYNTLYRITGVSNSKQVQVEPISAVTPVATSGLGEFVTANSLASVVGKSIPVSSLTYNASVGIGTVTTTSNHGFQVNNVVTLSGANSSLYNGSFVVRQVNSLTSFSINIGVGTTAPSTAGTIYAHRRGFASNAGNITVNDENLAGRQVTKYDNVTTNLSSPVTSATATTITIPVSGLDLNIGDYLEIGEEIVRISATVTSNTISVYRGVLGTPSQTHESGKTVRRIKPLPVELRRHSIIRSSGHTFEYVGYGPGNYSTAFPDRQDRQISAQEELISQSFKSDGGINFFSGMNDKGISYSGNKKLSTITGQEEVFDTPFQTVTGEDISSQSPINVINPVEGSFSNSIRVEGGPNNKVISKFDGPVIFTNKITSTSNRGVEANSLFIQGDATISRKYTVGVSTPTNAGNPGDVVYQASPESGGSLGWVYATDNNWKKFGLVSTSSTSVNIIADRVSSPSFIGTFTGDGSGLINVSDIWETDAIGVHTSRPIGIGTDSAKAGFGLYVEGSTSINGTLRVYEIIESATISAGILTATTVQNIDLGDNNVYYFTSPAQGNWTLNFRSNASQTLNDFLKIGESMTVAVMTTQGSTPYYNTTVQIDGVTQAVKYYGGNQITFGNANSIDLYTYVIIKTAANTYTVLYSQSQYS